jgi:hypothetical protein
VGTFNEFQIIWLSLSVSVVVCYNKYYCLNMFCYLRVFKHRILESGSISVIRCEDEEVSVTVGPVGEV